ncbi:SepM family pheromone-processing serine protease [Lactobacillus sp.]|uniref:SepM family pheromone-processing serine protease n=1 Tax=Lactobacillus sp. TaxID=1591 RepID=UPI0019BA65B1|nr:SepM family pheromone-processing serine protease [Lactobacillus sp.]MBD5430082.1 PDZ domain-containing protein [Lactobacillus sp.]
MKKKNNSRLQKWLLGLAAFFVVIVICLWPTNYYIEAPGSADQISQYIKSPAKKANRNFYLVTVSERRAVVIDYLLSFFNKNESRYSKDELMGNQTNAAYNQMQQYYMENSQNNAKYYAAKKAGIYHKRKYLGVYVMDIMTNSTFKNKLKIGDTVTKVNGNKFESTKKLISYIQKQKVKSKITVEVLRNGKYYTYSGKVVRLKSTKKNGIGIQLVDHTQVVTKPKIKIDVAGIGGPSAGLMFTLEMYQIFTNKNLSNNQKIAGTGTIDENGKVGMIGGVDKKVIAASKQGIKIFFAPTDQPAGVKKSETNYAEAVKTAKRIHTKMKIVPVATFDDALRYLENLK